VLLDNRVVTPEGRLLTADEAPPEMPEDLAARLAPDAEGAPTFVLARDGDRTVAITQRDVRELQLATGAIRAGVRILLKRAGLDAGKLRRVLLAGGFGTFIRRSCAQRIGLLPAGVPHEAIQYVGNVSLSGARWALLSTEARAHGEQVARAVRRVDLSSDAAFQMEFAEAMIFPER
jgi:uncharacterized 2Fe-2S/4Fe-4S cluster protein (DUF4445 family)